MDIQAKGLDYRALNEAIRAAGPSCRITGCLGQRFIGAGMSGRRVEIDGIPGNARTWGAVSLPSTATRRTP